MKKRVLSLLVCLCMAMTLLPTAALAAGDEVDPEPAPAPVSPHVIITPTGAEDVVELDTDTPFYVDGRADTNGSGNWTAHFDATQNTLTLKGFELDGSVEFISDSASETKLVLQGTNTITNTDGYAFLLYSNDTDSEDIAECTISGGGSLTATGTHLGIGIEDSMNIKVDGCKVIGKATVAGGQAGIVSEYGGGITVTNGTLEGTGDGLYGIGAEFITAESGATISGTGYLGVTGGSITVNEGATVTGTGATGAITIDGNRQEIDGCGISFESITINGGTLTGTASGENSQGVTSPQITARGGTLTGTADGYNSYGIGADIALTGENAFNMTVTDGDVSGTASGENSIGIMALSAEISGGLVAGSGDYAGSVFENTLNLSGGSVAGKALGREGDYKDDLPLGFWAGALTFAGGQIEGIAPGESGFAFDCGEPVVNGVFRYMTTENGEFTLVNDPAAFDWTDEEFLNATYLLMRHGASDKHVHVWSSEWYSDATGHWHNCTVSTCDTGGKSPVEAHVYDNSTDTTCNTCGYVRTVSSGGSSSGGSSSGGSSSGGSSSGGSSSGGGSSSSGNNQNSDGSTTTKTEDKTTGTVTETTTRTDGSQTVVETQKDGTVTTTETDSTGNKTETVEKPDGSSVTTIEQKDGTTATVSTSADGQTEADVKLTAAAVSAAQQSGEAVSLPIPEVKAARSTADAAAITVNTASSEPVKVEIPTESPTPGTVAVLVNADGTEEVIKTSTPTADGIAVSLPDGATVKIIDNSKNFSDVASVHWSEDAVDFVSARDLFSGTTDSTFTPNAPMTRAMLMTVLARFDGTDTNGGETWYKKGLDWAVSKGISDGSSPNGYITREQLASMLWRYMGSPAASGDLDGFNDADSVSGYAQDAMRWAVENGILNGMNDSTLAPGGQATRAQVAQVLMNFIQSDVVK